MIPQGSSFQNNTSSGVDSNDWFESAFEGFGDTVVNMGSGGGLSVSTPALIAAAVVIGVVVWKVK